MHGWGLADNGAHLLPRYPEASVPVSGFIAVSDWAFDLTFFEEALSLLEGETGVFVADAKALFFAVGLLSMAFLTTATA